MESASAHLSLKSTERLGEPESVLSTGIDWLAQLLCWSLLIGLVPVAIGVLLPMAHYAPAPLCGALAEALPIVVAISIACYAWIRFCNSKHIKWLATGAAFSLFAVFAGAGSYLNTIDGSRADLHLAGQWYIALSRAAPGALLLLAAVTNQKLASSWTRRGHVQFFLLWTIFTTATIVGALYLANYAARSVASDEAVLALMKTGAYLLSAVVCLLAVMTYARRTVTLHDRIPRVLCLWLLPTAMACGVRAIGVPNCPDYWWQAHLLDITAATVAAVGLNIDSAISDGQSTERLASIQAMHDISWSLAAAANLSSMLSAFVRVLANVAGAHLVAIYLLDEAAESLRLEAAHGDDDGFLRIGALYSLAPQPRPGFHSGHTARALKSQSVQVVEDVFSDVEFVPWRTIAQHNGWTVSIPLLLHGRIVIGALNLYIVQDRAISPDKMNLLETMAGLVAPAIENRRNFVEAAAMQKIAA